jgi:hypothetical protein
MHNAQSTSDPFKLGHNNYFKTLITSANSLPAKRKSLLEMHTSNICGDEWQVLL